MWEVDNTSPFPLLLWSLLHLIFSFLLLCCQQQCLSLPWLLFFLFAHLLPVFCSHKYFPFYNFKVPIYVPLSNISYLLDTKYPLMLFPLLSLLLDFPLFWAPEKKRTRMTDVRLRLHFLWFCPLFFTLPQGFLNLAPTQLYPLPPAYRVITYVKFNISCSHISHSIERGWNESGELKREIFTTCLGYSRG